MLVHMQWKEVLDSRINIEPATTVSFDRTSYRRVQRSEYCNRLYAHAVDSMGSGSAQPLSKIRKRRMIKRSGFMSRVFHQLIGNNKTPPDFKVS